MRLAKIAATLGVIGAIAVGSAVPAAAWYGYGYYHRPTTIITMATIIRTTTMGTTIIVTSMGTTRTIVASGVTDWRSNSAIW